MFCLLCAGSAKADVRCGANLTNDLIVSYVKNIFLPQIIRIC